MNIKSIKRHNQNIKDAIDLINECYRYTKNNYLGMARISEYSLKDFGLIKSIKGVFAPKSYLIKGYNKLVYEYNLINTRNDLAVKKIENLRKEMKSEELANLKKKEIELKELYKNAEKDENYEKCAKLCKQLDIEQQNLNATKTKKVDKTRLKLVPEYHTRFTLIGKIMMPLTETTYHSKTVHYVEEIEVPDEEKRAQAAENIKRIKEGLACIPNFEKNIETYNLFQQTKQLSAEIKSLIENKKAAENEIKCFAKDVDTYTDTLLLLKKRIDIEKDLILKYYPKIKSTLLDKIATSDVEEEKSTDDGIMIAKC